MTLPSSFGIPSDELLENGSLADRLADGEPFVVTFGGQGVDWVAALASLIEEHPDPSWLADLVAAAESRLTPVADELARAGTNTFDPMAWLGADRPAAQDIHRATQSVPGVLLTQLATTDLLAREGLDLTRVTPAAALGHSQGILGVAALASRRHGNGEASADLLALARLIGAAASTAGRRAGLLDHSGAGAMLAVTGAPVQELRDLLEREGDAADPVVLAVVNAPRSAVVSGSTDALRRFRAVLDRYTAASRSAHERKETGGRVFDPNVEFVPAEVAFHHPGLGQAVILVEEWARRCGLDEELAAAMARVICVEPLDWPEALRRSVPEGTRWVIDLGPGRVSAALTARDLVGRGAAVVEAGTVAGRDELFTPGATHEEPSDWSAFAPHLIEHADGRRTVDTAFTRLTGKSPILLAGMTPTTVDPAIVAAAANAGHWAELAGGGQVTGEVFAGNVARLTELLEPGRTAQFNALYLDPYLWGLQLGRNRLVQKARQAGAPFDGVVVSAGIPELEDALALIEDLRATGISHVVLKPGTVAQIGQVVAIARAAEAQGSDLPLIVHVEGGAAGGHHSWEDLDELLLATYADLRSVPGLVVCVGGGVGTPERATELLTGAWSLPHGLPAMPLDGILLGTVAMATLEATTSPAVKQLLVDTPGAGGWVPAGGASGGVASGRSQLGADIHEIDNTASRCGRLLDEVAGDELAVEARRDEIIAALAQTAKPWFGDVATMTYAALLRRWVELAGPVDGAWLDATLEQRFHDLLDRAVARLHPQAAGPIDRLPREDDPEQAIATLVAAYPEATTCVLHPADAQYFVDVCRGAGKPVPFVPVIDADVRRWWRSDSLWQAHDARFDADAVIVIPGPVAVAGITEVDEPVADLLDRFEAATVSALESAGADPIPAVGRRAVGEQGSLLAAARACQDALWAGRVVANPLRLVGADDVFTDDAGVSWLRLALGHNEVSLRLDLGAVASGGLPVFTEQALDEGMRELLGVTAGGVLPEVVDGVARHTALWTTTLAAEHLAVTSPTRVGGSGTRTPRPESVPDALVGLAWPAVFACIGPDEGLLDLVHLDHRIDVTALPEDCDELDITATREAVRETAEGRVIEVTVEIARGGQPVADLHERFMVRHRVGSAELLPPAPLAEGHLTRPRSRLTRFTVTAPVDMAAFATVSGDHNPLHTAPVAARLAGLPGPIVHGMWLSAVAQRAAVDAGAARRPRTLTSWLVRWLGPVLPGAAVEVSVERVGVIHGETVVEVVCRVDGEMVMVASGLLAAPATVYAFPGQGIQRKGMGMEGRARSAASRAVWDRADAHTRAALGFSVLEVVRDNPQEIWADGEVHQHPDGVLFLTQFTQVAMATLACAQVAELREEGVFVEEAITCGHSVGEYNALAAVTGILPLETLIEIVFRRGMAMHHLVERDALGRSRFQMAAIRPSQAGIADDEVADFVAGVAESSGEFLQVVNENLRGSQYAIAGTVRGLEVLKDAIEEARARVGGRAAYVLVPGIDVPFHSHQLRPGVGDFRSRLEDLLPERIDATVLIGRYIPNLVPRLFSLERAFIAEVAEYVDSAPLQESLADWDVASSDPDLLARTLLIELLAWQFASPVRWIETQDLLFGDPVDGGLGVERFVEVGLAEAPTLANLAAQTVRLPAFDAEAQQVLNVDRDAAIAMAQDIAVVHDEDNDADNAGADEPTTAVAPQAEAPAQSAPTTTAPAPVSGTAERPDDLGFAASDAARVLVALRTKVRPDQIGDADTIDGLCDGVSSRRNQVLVDLGAELGLGAIDGAADAEWSALAPKLDGLVRAYRPFGPVLTDAVADGVREATGALGGKPAAVADRVLTTWQLGEGWLRHVTATIALLARTGASTRGGALGAETSPADLGALVDSAVASVAAAHGIRVDLPATDTGAVTVDASALSALTAATNETLASTARHLLARLEVGTDGAAAEGVSEPDLDAELVSLVESELGRDWARAVTPSFDARRAVVFDDRWASIREDLARIWSGDEVAPHRCFIGLDDAAAAQTRWWLERARREQRTDLVARYGRILSEADVELEWADEVAIVTGAAPRSIGAAVVSRLLRGGATVVATASRLDPERVRWFRSLYRDHAAPGAALWVLPANLASFGDIDAVVDWVTGPVVESAAGVATEIRPALAPTLLFPFAAPPVRGSAEDVGSRSEVELRVLLLGVERMVTAFASRRVSHRPDRRLHVVLPGSPNRGRFGGDGAYGEAKAALDAFVQRWHAEAGWSSGVTLAHALIGWVRGTGLMGHNDPLVEAVAAAGVQTFSTEEMAEELLALCGPEARAEAARMPLSADLTGGLGSADLDLAALAREALQDSDSRVSEISDVPDESASSASGSPEDVPLEALTHPPGWHQEQPDMVWPSIDARPEDLVVLIGAGEVGPVGSSRTRLQLEIDDELAPSGIIELAWATGLVTWAVSPTSGWCDAATGEQLTEAEVVDRFGEQVSANVGIRRYRDDGALTDGTAPLMVSVFVEEDTSFVVRTREEAEAFAADDPQHTRVAPAEDGWTVTRLAGGRLRVPRRFRLTRSVGAQIPDGFDPAVWGLGSMTESIDRLAAWNLVATVDAFVSAGVTPAELLRFVHPTRFGNSQGTGIGGMRSTRRMYVDALLGEDPPTDILQEALPNVIAAHAVQSFLGGYGPMVHPVAACATAAVSLEEAVDKIRVDKASVVVAGGFDDLGIEGIVGFGAMNATAETDQMLAKGLEESAVCRPNDRRRGGFVEGQGGGTLIVARGDVAAELGLPVLGVVAYAASFSDGIHTSIPAPGLGALGAGLGGTSSPLAKGLANLGLSADDVAVISKHDTSTAANDPNESYLHETLAEAIGRSAGNPLYVVSQKSLTGHAKGGAAAFQMIGLCQTLANGIVPPNRNLDCVDPALAPRGHHVWLRESLRTGPLRAGLVTSLGFGHVSAVVALAHPAAFAATLAPAERAIWRQRASARLADGERRRLAAMCGGAALYERPAGRRFTEVGEIRADESAMLLDPTARLGANDTYARSTR